MLKKRKIRYSGIHAARFVTHGEDGQDRISPIVIWIGTYPTTTAHDAHLASSDILAVLEAYEVHGTVIEWFEGIVQKLSGPALLRVTQNTDPTYYVRRFLTAGLGIATAEREDEDAQGSVAFFFRENKDQHGNPSSRVLAVSNCHVLRKNTSIPYKFKDSGTPPQHIRLAGSRRFQRGLNEIKAAIATHENDAGILVREIVELEAKLQSEDKDEAEEAVEALEAKRVLLAKAKRDNATLNAFHKEVSSQWNDIGRRNIGHIDWAPEISVDLNVRCYTRDIGTFEVDAEKFRAQFKGNVVDLGTNHFVFLIITSSYFMGLQGPSILRNNSSTSSILIEVAKRRSSSPPIVSSGSMVVSRTSS